MKNPEAKSMLMNWPERVWIYSPLRVFFLRREMLKWLRLAPPPAHLRSLALEIGCGLGKGAQLIARDMGYEQVTAFDLEPKLVRWASARIRPSLKEQVNFFVGDAQDLPFGSDLFDAVINFGIIHHVLDWRRCISEIARVLVPGGLFYFEEIYPPLYANFLLKHLLRHPRKDRFNGPQFIGELNKNGLRLVEGVAADSIFGIVGVARLCE